MDKINFINTFAKFRPSANFIQIHNYRNELGEVANYNLVFHISYESALQRSYKVLDQYLTSSQLELEAKCELLNSYEASLDKLSQSVVDKHYSDVFSDSGEKVKGIKLHKATETLHLTGAVVNKKLVSPGRDKRQGNKSPLTMAKDHLRMMTPLSKFRQFKISCSNLEKISVEKIQIFPSF